MSILRITPRVQPVTFDARIPIGLRGRVHVAKLNRAGQRIPVRIDRNRRAWQRIWDHEQGNLITDGGLDYGMGASETNLLFAGLTSFVHVGTGNTAPATSDTALVSELSRTNSTLALGDDLEASLPSTGEGMIRRVRAFDYDEGNGTLAEFGGGADDTTTVLTRALFVDEFDTPTPITKTSDELLIITYDLLASVSPTSMTSAGTVTITGSGTFDISSMAYRAAAGSTSASLPQGIWNSYVRLAPITSASTTYDSSGGAKPPGATNGFDGFEAYTSGTFERTATGVYGPQTSDATLAGYEIGAYNSSFGTFAAMFAFRFDSPSSLAKDKDYRLTLSASIAVARS